MNSRIPAGSDPHRVSSSKTDFVDPVLLTQTSMPVTLNTFLRLSGLLFLASVIYLAVQIATNKSPHHGLPLDIYTRVPLFDLVGYVQKMPNVHQSSLPFLRHRLALALQLSTLPA